MADHVGEDIEQGKHFIAGRSAYSYCHYRNQYDSSSENCESIYLEIRLYLTWKYIQKKTHPTRRTFINYVHSCLLLLFRIAGNWKQHRGTSIEEWVKKMCYILKVGYYSAIRKK